MTNQALTLAQSNPVATCIIAVIACALLAQYAAKRF